MNTTIEAAIAHGSIMIPISINFFSSIIAFIASYKSIPLLMNTFIKAGLSGKDMSKSPSLQIPESMGVVSGAIFLINMFVFIPVCFYPHILYDYDLPLKELISYLSALLSICCMIFLGFVDDVLDLKWRDRLILPLFASLPLLLVYYVNIGRTTVVVPIAARFLFGTHVNLGILYYVYMAMLVIFCTNAINIYAGINGLETGQSVVIAISILIFNIVEMSGQDWQHHLFSLYFMLPYIAVALGLYYYNRYPAKVFVGDTFCYFSGITFAVTGILGHFSKTLLLFFLPQIFNFIYSVPQLFRFFPCPRHRLPKFLVKENKLTTSTFLLEKDKMKPLAKLILFLYRTFGLLNCKEVKKDSSTYLECNNCTLINLVLKFGGPIHEGTLEKMLMLLQVLCTCLAFVIRYPIGNMVYDNLK